MLFTVVFGSHAGEYWITPDTSYGADGTGAGTAASPWVRSTATSFDSCINGTGCVPTTGIPANSTIHLMSGTFRTVQGLTLKANWKLRGAGIEVTTVQMDSSLSPPAWALPVIGLPCCYRTDGTEVSDMTVDCNLQNISGAACISGVRLQGGETKISRVKTINWGSKNTSECFILSIGAHWFYSMGMQTNCVIEECIIGPPANVTHTQGASAITIGGGPDILGAYRETPGPGWIANAVVRDCVISTVSVGGAGEPLYFNGIGSGSSVIGMKVTGNKVFDTDGTAIMSSCGSLLNCSIENNMLIDVNAGILFSGEDCCYTPCSWSTNWAKENIHVSDNIITVKGGGIGISMSGMSMLTDPRRHATNVVVKNNYVGAADSGSISGINFWQSDNITFENNTIDSNGGNASATDETTTFSSIHGNKTSAGADVTIFAGFNDDNSDQTIIFSPANGVGWYRLLKSWNREFSSSNIRITRRDLPLKDNTGADNAVLDLEFNYAVKAWTTDLAQLGEINVLQYNSWNATSPITQVRIGNSGGSQVVFVDVYLATYPLDKPLLIRSSGGKNHQFESAPIYRGTTNEVAPVKVITVGPGLRTTGPLYAGTPNNQLTDAAGKLITASFNDNAITDTKLRDALATSVIGRSSGTSGDPADIQAAADGQFLRRSGGVLGFGAITASELPTHTHAAADIVSGLIATAQLGSGTASSSTFLRGDQTWAVLAPPSTFRKTADQTINGNAYQDITGLSFPVAANTDYAFEFTIVFSSATATTGFGFSVNGPASPTYIDYVVTYQTTANATAGTDVMTQRHDTAYNAMAATAATVTAGVNLHAHIKGTLRNGANAGTLSARVRSELANNDLVVKRGSWGTSF